LKFTATDSVVEEKTNATSCGVLSPKINKGVRRRMGEEKEEG
jgi:hypothetical protein